MVTMKRNILILCCGYPYATDSGFGYHVFKALEKTQLPGNVEVMEVGYSACMVPHVIEGMDKLIIVDTFYIQGDPGIILRQKPEEVALTTLSGKTDTAKLHLIDELNMLKLIGKCPETVFIGIIPKDTETEGERLTPEIERKIPEAIAIIFEEINKQSIYPQP
jgi:hydrogenase maturation protease